MLSLDTDNKRKIRDVLRLCGALICTFVYVPHLIFFVLKRNDYIISDIRSMKRDININLVDFWALLYLLHNNAYFRKLFYYRIGPVATLFIGWWRPGDKYLSFSQTMKLGKGVIMAHPYASVLNAESIGDNFNFRNLTTIGSNKGLCPKIGNNVTLGANVTIIGNITIGDNVFVGAGSIVVKDVPDNCIVAGNPAKIIRYLK